MILNERTFVINIFRRPLSRLDADISCRPIPFSKLTSNVVRVTNVSLEVKSSLEWDKLDSVHRRVSQKFYAPTISPCNIWQADLRLRGIRLGVY
jgi:hypothetical protein